MGVYIQKKESEHSKDYLIYPENIPINSVEGYRYFANYLYDTRQLDWGFKAYWNCYMQGDWDALINIGQLLLMCGFETKGRWCICEGYSKSTNPKAYYTYLKCIIIFGWDIDIDVSQHVLRIANNPDEDAFEFLVWYYAETNEIEHSITAFLQLKYPDYQLRWLRHYLTYMLKMGKNIHGQVMMKQLKEKYPFVFTIELLNAHLDSASYAYVIDYAEKHQGYNLYQSIAYYNQNQIISSVKAANEIDIARLSSQERIMAYRHLARLAQIGADFTREIQYLEKLLQEYKQQERYIRQEIRAHELWLN